MTFSHRALAAWGCALAIAAQAETPVEATTAGAASTTAPPPPAELFYQRPAIERTALSPSGRWLAMGTRGAGNRTMLVVFDL